MLSRLSYFSFVLLGVFCLSYVPDLRAQEPRKIVFLAGGPSHGPGEHEHRAGCLLLKGCLDKVPGVTSVVYSNGWPNDPSSAFAQAAALVIYSDGGSGQPLLSDDRLETIGQLMKKGVGLGCIHYAVEPTLEKGEEEFLEWIGGCFELNWSVNPTWTPDFKSFPSHVVTRGVKPFKLYGEWYFHMRCRPEMQGVTPILSAVAPASTMHRGDGPHEGNPAVRASVKAGEVQHMMWVCERANGGRGFGFTGGHYHKTWGNDNARNLVLNAILWTAKVEVPPEGVASQVTAEDLQRNLDAKSK